MNETIGERLRRLRKAANLTQAALAAKVGVVQSAIGNIEVGTRGYGSNVVTFAKILGVTPEYLQCETNEVDVSGQGEMNPSGQPQEIDLENNPDYPAIRHVKFKLSAGASGFGVDYSDEDAAPMVFKRQWYERKGLVPAKLFATKVINSSMEPGLYDGDTVVVNTASTTPKDGTVFAVNYEGELVIKRLLRDAGAWWLCSDNPNQHKYPRKQMTDQCYIVGEIVHKQSERI
jgi:phage repressor protein C with HTH and peptisase S24 domain